MGFAWTADDVGDSVLPAVDQAARQQPGQSRLADRQPDGRHASSPAGGTSWTAGARHRRPTLLTRSGQAVAHRITALASTDPPRAPHPSASLAHPPRRRTMAARKYWT